MEGALFSNFHDKDHLQIFLYATVVVQQIRMAKRLHLDLQIMLTRNPNYYSLPSVSSFEDVTETSQPFSPPNFHCLCPVLGNTVSLLLYILVTLAVCI